MPPKCFKKNISFWICAKKNIIDVAKPKPKQPTATFQQALRATLIIGQMFSLLPVVGVFSNDANNVKFVRTSSKCVYSLLSLFGQFLMLVLSINKVVHTTTSLSGTSSVVFYLLTSLTTMTFFQMARRWPQMVQHITRTEEIKPSFDVSLNKKCNITCAVVLLLALFEHILSLLSAIGSAASCLKLLTYKTFVIYFYSEVFNYIPYSPYLGILTQFIHIQSTFIWNFSDLFVICMSYYLTSRLEQVNKKLLSAQGKYLPEVFWRATREDYCRATQTVRKVDDVISGVVFISFASNLFFICMQLFHTLEDGLKGSSDGCHSKRWKSGPLGGHEAAIYFIFSLVFLLSRSIAVSLIASQVNTASSVPAPVLYDVPSPVYCIEVQIFLDQVNGDKVALSGLQFFLITRGLLLTVASTIVTYELVMFQVSSSSSTTTLFPNVTTTMITTMAGP